MKPCCYIFLIIFTALYDLAEAQTVKHQSYTTYYNVSKGEPDSVSWQLTPEMVSCSDKVRKDKSAQDPLIPGSTKKTADVGTGYNRDHMFNWDDAKCDNVDDKVCFYMTNMVPQPHAFNAGDWGTQTRKGLGG